jgi:hypothetical protein
MSKRCTVHQMLSDQNFAGIKPTLIDDKVRSLAESPE